MNNGRDTRSNLIAILGLIIAIASLLFGDNLFQQLTGKSFFSPKTGLTRTALPTSIIIATRSPEFFYTINARIMVFRNYATDPNNGRVFGNTFNQATTKFIGWMIGLALPAPGRRIDFVIHQVYYNPDGSVLIEGDKDFSIESDSKVVLLSDGVGWNDAGRWKKGTYTLSLLIENKEFIEAVFVVE